MAEQIILNTDLYDNLLTERKGDYTAKPHITGTLYNTDIAARIVAARTEYQHGTILNILDMADSHKVQAIAEGKIGTVVSGYSQFTLWLPYEPGNWRQCKAKAGGGAMMDLSVHTIDLMEYITGMRVTEVASMNEKIAFPEPQYDVEDTSTILMRMENGAQCVVQSNFNIPDEASKWRVEFFGTKGRLLGDTMIGQIDGGRLNAVFIDKNVAYSAEQTHADDVGVEIPGDFGNMYTREIESFSDSILNNKPLVVPASDAVHVQRIMEKAYASGEELKILKI